MAIAISIEMSPFGATLDDFNSILHGMADRGYTPLILQAKQKFLEAFGETSEEALESESINFDEVSSYYRGLVSELQSTGTNGLHFPVVRHPIRSDQIDLESRGSGGLDDPGVGDSQLIIAQVSAPLDGVIDVGKGSRLATASFDTDMACISGEGHRSAAGERYRPPHP